MLSANLADDVTRNTEHRVGGRSNSTTLLCLVAAFSIFSLAGCGGNGGTDTAPGASVGTGTGTAAISWDPASQNEDGTPLTDLAGYKVYYGTNSPLDKGTSPSIDVGATTSYTLSGLTGGTYFFAATAYDALGNESALSDEVSKVIPDAT